jgi:hypothetical protein
VIGELEEISNICTQVLNTTRKKHEVLCLSFQIYNSLIISTMTVRTLLNHEYISSQFSLVLQNVRKTCFCLSQFSAMTVFCSYTTEFSRRG